MQSLKKANLKNKRVIVRCDFNVPLSKKGAILDDYKIKETLPTIEYLLSRKAKVILISHLGRPEAKDNPKKKDKKLSLKPVALYLQRGLKNKVVFISDCVGDKTREEVMKLKPGQAALLENVRFHKEEEENKDKFAKELSRLGEIYVNDAFGASHRSHASITGITKYLPSFAGLLLEKEIRVLRKMMKSPQKPLVAIVGGAKVETKAKLINKLSEIADFVLVGGLIAREIKEKDIYLNYPRKIVAPIDETRDGKEIGEKTVSLFTEKILKAKTVFFNGVLGQTEDAGCRKGTEAILKSIIKSGAFSVVGGGETVEFINSLGLSLKFNHLSTGGGAMISYLAGERLPGIAALDKWK
ncbi:MAG: phosphoglycerate kinase [Candidatus Paceibacterota bacterium]|jgi:phosphoglycerate kinase